MTDFSSVGGRCTGLLETGPMLCSTLSGSGFLTSGPQDGILFSFGAETRRSRWHSNFFVLGSDIWSYGVGIQHCKKGQDCLKERR